MAEIRWTFEAELWLKEIYEYIALDNPQAAKEVVDGIYTSAQMLKAHPKMGYTYDVPGKEEV
jgi:plasmid stabilization system protein ParE